MSTSSKAPVTPLSSICVFCGSSAGVEPDYLSASLALADCIAQSERALVYGGANIGLMGAVADRVLAGSGKVVGVIPKSLVDVEIAHPGLSELHITEGMHERKAKMAECCDAFIALPGGLGTLEELFEVLTWAQLGYHQKPIGLLNVNGFYDSLLAFLDHSAEQGFMKLAHRNLLHVASEPHTLIERLVNAEPLTTAKL